MNNNSFRPTRISNILIITSGARSEHCTDGTVDRLIQLVLSLKKYPILVLGPEGDDVLLSSRLAEKCDLAFDPNFANTGSKIFSSLQAGLHASNGAVLAISLKSFTDGSAFEKSFVSEDGRTPNFEFWNQLETETLQQSRTAGRLHVLTGAATAENPDVFALNLMQSASAADSSAGVALPQFPLGITAVGAIRLKELPAATEFEIGSLIRFATQASDSASLADSTADSPSSTPATPAA